MHTTIITRKIDEMMEVFDLVETALADRPEDRALNHTKKEITHFTKLLSAFVGRENEMLHSQRVGAVFERFFSLKDKLSAYLKDSLQESREWYVAALIVSESDDDLEDSMLAAHTVRECLKKGIAPWVAVSVTNSVMEKDIATLADANSAYEALLKAGKIKKKQQQ